MNIMDLPIKTRIRLGFDLFLIQAREKHGERFLYDRSSWGGTNKKLRICCAAHGWFDQVPYDHLKFDGGCYECSKIEWPQKVQKRSLERFLKKAQKVHAGKYEYDPLSWKGQKVLFKIKCPIHGWFEQVPYDHLRLYTGCPSCSYEKSGALRRTETSEMLARFKAVHGDRYLYNKFEYKGGKQKSIITCQIHGDFHQSPAEHLNYGGCQRCSKRHRWTTKSFAEEATIAHDGKYSYERAVYNGALKKLTITCPTHGDFTQVASAHLTRKDGCPKCSPTARTSLPIFLERCKKRFGNRYDYSQVDYVDVHTPVKIICRKHGLFEQPPSWHLSNAVGCTHCTHIVSNKETAWLDSLNLPETAQRNVRIKLGNRKRSVDAFDPASNTVLEFWGTYWHGHKDYFDPKAIHPICKKTYGELYAATQEKRRLIIEAGYTLVEIWEHEYDELARQGELNRPAGRLSVKKPRKLSGKTHKRSS